MSDEFWKDSANPLYQTPTNHRLVPGGIEYGRYEWVRDHIKPGSRVLDVGCNCGVVARQLHEDIGCEVVGVDIVPAFVEHCNTMREHPGRFYVGDFSRQNPYQIGVLGNTGPFGVYEGLYDVVTCLEVIEHPIYLRGFAFSARQCLKEDGLLIVSTPHPESARLGYGFMASNPCHTQMWTQWRLEQFFGPAVFYDELDVPDWHAGEENPKPDTICAAFKLVYNVRYIEGGRVHRGR